MLVIRRRAGESVLIGEDVEIQVTEIGPSRVKLCISAPREVTVLRKEVKLTREENVAAGRELPAGRLIEFATKLRV
ncbi:MAG: carbon storage regulator [Bryobacteraceae bacterium]|jgi:carbon storage regulator